MLIALLVVLFFTAHLVLSWVAKKTQASGASHAIAGAIQSEAKNPSSKVSGLISEILGTNETIELNSSQYDAIIDVLVSQKRLLDAPSTWKPGMTLNDPWGYRYRIILHRSVSNLPPLITVTNHTR